MHTWSLSSLIGIFHCASRFPLCCLGDEAALCHGTHPPFLLLLCAVFHKWGSWGITVCESHCRLPEGWVQEYYQVRNIDDEGWVQEYHQVRNRCRECCCQSGLNLCMSCHAHAHESMPYTWIYAMHMDLCHTHTHAPANVESMFALPCTCTLLHARI